MTKGDNDNLRLPFAIPYVEMEFVPNEPLLGLLEVAKVALGPSMPQANSAEALLLVQSLLAVIDRTMPPELQAQDVRVQKARRFERDLASILSWSREPSA